MSISFQKFLVYLSERRLGLVGDFGCCVCTASQDWIRKFDILLLLLLNSLFCNVTDRLKPIAMVHRERLGGNGFIWSHQPVKRNDDALRQVRIIVAGHVQVSTYRTAGHQPRDRQRHSIVRQSLSWINTAVQEAASTLCMFSFVSSVGLVKDSLLYSLHTTEYSAGFSLLRWCLSVVIPARMVKPKPLNVSVKDLSCVRQHSASGRFVTVTSACYTCKICHNYVSIYPCRCLYRLSQHALNTPVLPVRWPSRLAFLLSCPPLVEGIW